MKKHYSIWITLGYILAGILLMSRTAHAQNGAQGWPTTTPTAADYAQLPFSILVPIAPPAGWSSSSNIWLTAIWNRNASGAWYRNPQTPNQGRPAAVYLNQQPYLASASVTCYAEANYTFRCRDNVRGINRYYTCPVNVNFGQPVQWRSTYLQWPLSQVGWFNWSPQEKWVTGLDNRNWFPRVAHFVSNTGGKQLNCQYQFLPTIDVWAWVR